MNIICYTLLIPETLSHTILVPPLTLSNLFSFSGFLVCHNYFPTEQLPRWHESCQTFGSSVQMRICHLSQTANCPG